MKHNVILIAMAIVMTLAACSDNKIVYRGVQKQECEAILLSQRSGKGIRLPLEYSSYVGAGNAYRSHGY